MLALLPLISGVVLVAVILRLCWGPGISGKSLQPKFSKLNSLPALNGCSRQTGAELLRQF
ncbi:hypothetical protein ACNKHM_24585 [Shigella sonnei]